MVNALQVQPATHEAVTQAVLFEFCRKMGKQVLNDPHRPCYKITASPAQTHAIAARLATLDYTELSAYNAGLCEIIAASA